MISDVKHLSVSICLFQLFVYLSVLSVSFIIPLLLNILLSIIYTFLQHSNAFLHSSSPFTVAGGVGLGAVVAAALAMAAVAVCAAKCYKRMIWRQNENPPTTVIQQIQRSASSDSR